MQVKNRKLSYRLLALMLTLVMLLGMLPATALATDDTGETETPAQYEYVITSNVDWATSYSSTELPYLSKSFYNTMVVDDTNKQTISIYNYSQLVGIALDYVTVDGLKIPFSEFENTTATETKTIDTSSCPNLNGREVQVYMQQASFSTRKELVICFTKGTGDVTGDIKIDYVFKKATYVPTVTSSDTSKGTAALTNFENTESGTNCVITATPVYGYKFTKLTDEAGNEYPSADGKTVTVEVTQSGKTFTAHFEERDDVYHYVITSNLDWAEGVSSTELPYLTTYNITNNIINPNNDQSIGISNHGNLTYAELDYVLVDGLKITLAEFEANPEYFAVVDTSSCPNLNGRQVKIGMGKHYTYGKYPQLSLSANTGEVTGDIKVEFVFIAPTYTTTVTSSDTSKGTVKLNDEYENTENGTKWTVTATPVYGYKLTKLTDEAGNEYPSADGETVTVEVTQSGKSFTAQFEERDDVYHYVITSNIDWATSSRSTELPYLSKDCINNDLVDDNEWQTMSIDNYSKLVGIELEYVTIDGLKIPLSEFTENAGIDTSSCPNLNGREVSVEMWDGIPYIYFVDLTGEVTGDIKVDFVFKTAKYTTSVASSDTSKGTAALTGYEDTESGTKWTVTATPVYGYKFTKLTDEAGNEYPSADGETVTVEVTQSGKSFTAQFEKRDDVYSYVITSNIDWATSSSSTELPYLYKTNVTDNFANETLEQVFAISNYAAIDDTYKILYIDIDGVRVPAEDVVPNSTVNLDVSKCANLNGRTVSLSRQYDWSYSGSYPKMYLKKCDNPALGDIKIHYEFRPAADFPTVNSDTTKGTVTTKLSSIGENETVWTVSAKVTNTYYHFANLEDEAGNKYYPDENGIVTITVPAGSGKTYTANYDEYDTYTTPEKDENGVYLLDSIEDMLWFADKNAGQKIYNINAALTADIDLTGTPWKMGSSYYYGTFDGRGHTLTVSFGEGESLFYVIGDTSNNKGTVKNIVIKGSSIKSPIAYMVWYGGTVSGCINYATVTNGSGLVDTVKCKGIIENCINYGNCSAEGRIGGIAGECSGDDSTSGKVLNCANYGNITSESLVAGGIVAIGSANGTISDCLNAGNISGVCAGGILGYGANAVTNCYNTGNVTVTSAYVNDVQYNGYAGGICGKMDVYYSSNAGANIGSALKNCYSTGTVTGVEGSVLGAVVGMNKTGKDAHGYYISGDLPGVAKLAEVNTGSTFGSVVMKPSTDSTVAKTADEMKTEAFVETLGTDYFKADLAKKNNGYPVLVWEDNEAPAKVTVYVSVSEDGNYVIGNDKDSTVIASLPMTVEYFDLADYGLEAFYRYDDNGDLIEKPTLLHVYIKLIEQYYLGGKTLVVGESKLNLTDDYYALLITGSPGSLYMQNFWGHGENLMYYVNHEYPIMTGTTGATADWIVLEDYDAVDLAMYSDWYFYQDPNAGFPYFTDTDGNSIEAFESDVNVEHTLTVRKGVADLNGGESSNAVGNVQVYYTTSLTGGDVTQWTPLTKADAKGNFTFSFDKKGTYYVGVAGTTVSAPAVVRVSVYDSSELPYAATIGETEYETLTAALEAAKSGETVVVAKPVEENMLVVTDGVTLDLNGKTVTANYIIGLKNSNVVDTLGYGLLKVSQGNIVLPETNAMIPAWNGEGYIFDTVSIVDNTSGMGIEYTGEGTFKFKFVPFFGDKLSDTINSLLTDNGADDNDLSIVVRLEWNTEEGAAYQSFVYNNEQVKTVIAADGRSAFTLTVNGYKGIDNLKVSAMILSETGVQFAGNSFTVE